MRSDEFIIRASTLACRCYFLPSRRVVSRSGWLRQKARMRRLVGRFAATRATSANGICATGAGSIPALGVFARNRRGSRLSSDSIPSGGLVRLPSGLPSDARERRAVVIAACRSLERRGLKPARKRVQRSDARFNPGFWRSSLTEASQTRHRPSGDDMDYACCPDACRSCQCGHGQTCSRR